MTKERKKKGSKEKNEEEEGQKKRGGGGMSERNKWEVDFLACEIKFIGLC